MVRSSGQHKCALIFCGSLLILLGAGITASGFVYDFHEPYEDLPRSYSRNATDSTYFTHTQYWLGIPLVLFGMFVLATAFIATKCLIVLGFVLSPLLLVTSICAVALEGFTWRALLRATIDGDCRDLERECSCAPGLGLTCNEVKYATVMSSIVVGFSAIAIVICQFCWFVYCRILGWMSHVKYDNPIDDYYSKAMGSRFANGHSGRANQVMLNSLS